MASLSFSTQPVPRELLAEFAKNPRLVKLLENLTSDVTSIPSVYDSILALIDEAQQTGDAARSLAQLVQETARQAADLALQAREAPVAAPVIYEAFPVGAVFTSTVSTDPAQLLGYGVWSQYAAGQVLVGYAAGDPDFGTPGGTGGAKTASISAHTGTAVAAHPDHTHDVTSNVTATLASLGPGTTSAVTSITNNPVTSASASVVLNHSVTQPDNHADISVLQPYLTVYFWRRTA